MNVHTEPLSKDNFSYFLEVLNERSEAPVDYYKWKYLTCRETNMPRGFLVRWNNEYVGCAGIIPRVWKNSEGRDISATWVADVFVHSKARGMGIGSALFTAVKDLSPVSIFIPGTESVRSVTTKIGYHPLSEIPEFEVLLRPWKSGWLRGGGTTCKRFLRAMKTAMIWRAQRTKSSETGIDINLSFPDIDVWSNRAETVTMGIPHLVRSKEFLNWLKQMPSNAPNNPKIWWHWQNHQHGVLGLIEFDRWGAKRSRIFDYWGKEPVWNSDLANLLVNSMHHIGVDYMQIYGFPEILKIKKAVLKNQLPLFAYGKISTTSIRGLDRESWYRDITFVRREY